MFLPPTHMKKNQLQDKLIINLLKLNETIFKFNAFKILHRF